MLPLSRRSCASSLSRASSFLVGFRRRWWFQHRFRTTSTTGNAASADASLQLRRIIKLHHVRCFSTSNETTNKNTNTNNNNSSGSATTPTAVRIGNVSRTLETDRFTDAQRQKIPPSRYLDRLRGDAVALRHLRWLLQKDCLGQDALLVGTGTDGAVQRRRLALAYARLAHRPVEWLTISADTTESDLKQRRVLRTNTDTDDSNATTATATTATAKTNIAFEDQAPVRAALNGHLLVLDGLERAERNVLPTLNNLLENRELPLEDGRLLVSHERHQQLVRMQSQQSQQSQTEQESLMGSSFLVPVHPDFRCLALYSTGIGNTTKSASSHSQSAASPRLDPPVRSRFQIRRVDPPTSDRLYEELLSLNSSNENDNDNDTTWTIQPELAQQLAVFAASVDGAVAAASEHSVAPHFPVTTALPAVARARALFPRQPLPDLLRRVYPTSSPSPSPSSPSAVTAKDNDPLEHVCRELGMTTAPTKDGKNQNSAETYYEVDRIEAIPNDPCHLRVHFRPTASSLWDSLSSDPTVSVTVPSGGHTTSISASTAPIDASDDTAAHTTSTTNPTVAHSIVPTRGTQHVLTALLQEHAVGRDVLLLSPKGQGKSHLAQHFAHLLRYTVHLFPLYKEMTAQDLLLRRTSGSSNSSASSSSSSPSPSSDTQQQRQWTESPLLTAARTGQLCVLDGIDKVAPDALATLQSLLTDRIVELPDGTRYSSAASGGTSSSSTTSVTIHPSFRVLALASSSSSSSKNMKQNAIVGSIFSTLTLPDPSRDCLRDILQPHNAYPDEDLEKILDFHELLLEASDECGVQPLSIRTLLRLVRHGRVDAAVTARSDHRGGSLLHDNICSCLLAELLPPTQRATLESLLRSCGIVAAASPSPSSSHKKKRRRDRQKGRDKQQEQQAPPSLAVEICEETNTLRMGDFSMARSVAHKPELVPSPFFFDIPSHLQMMQTLLGEWSIGGERAFLLLGNQGTGKNKIVDRICELANFEREYIQLHRDSTISQLTLSPSLEDGKIVWKDSPLVRAVTEGRALVIDEADKAPLEVVAVLKSLVEDGQLLLADGRRILRHGADKDKGEISIHKNFTAWVLANRPGRLFHGNDFYRELGDCFNTKVLANPDLESEVSLLQEYAPDVDEQVLRRIAASFDELRLMFQRGDIPYPYSTRESVAVAKHLQAYPDDDVIDVLQNVLSMDSFDEHLFASVGTVFRNHGFPFQSYKVWRKAMQATQGSSDLRIEYQTDRSVEGKSNSPPPLSGPKIGKWDENNEAHVGGNQWQGGTGGSDTAGLGGRGGPYRLDRGHKVHQVSDSAKGEVSKEAQAASRRIAQKALDDRLREIGMSSEEYETYHDFLEPIKGDIANLRATLEAVEFKTTERDWIKRQTDGELDDSRLVEGIAGEKHVYKRRGVVQPTHSSSSPKRHKRLRFVVDCSGSMYRFNGFDNRLNRCLQATALVMESLDGMDEKFIYSIVGHSGDSRCIDLVDFGDPPKNSKERLRVLQTMVAHSQFTQSGDNTLGAIQQAIKDVSSYDLGSDDDADVSSIVIAISDANLERYGISPRELGRAMRPGSAAGNTKAFCIFIASFGDEAEEIRRELPLGRGFVCMDSGELPGIVRDILTSEIE